MRHDAARGWVHPVAIIGDASAGADGADDGARGDFNFVGALDDVVEGHSEVLPAKGVETDGVGVAIDGGAVADAVAFGDGGGAAPVHEVQLDEVALRVLADLAAAPVTDEVCDFRELSAAVPFWLSFSVRFRGPDGVHRTPEIGDRGGIHRTPETGARSWGLEGG